MSAAFEGSDLAAEGPLWEIEETVGKEGVESGEGELREADAFLEDSYSREPVLEDVTLRFPSGATLRIVTGPRGRGKEHYDPWATGNPLSDTSEPVRSKLLSPNFNVGELMPNATITSLMHGQLPRRDVQRKPLAGASGEVIPPNAVGGWNDADKSGQAWNSGEKNLGTIRRVPLEGLTVGKLTEMEGANDTLTDEKAGGKAILLVPRSLNPKLEVDALVHLHGYTEKFSRKTGKRIYRPYAGWRQHRGSGAVRDVALDRVEAQLEATGQSQMVAILPQGGVHSEFGDGGDRYSLDIVTYTKHVLWIATQSRVWAVEPTLRRTIVSAHSGGGHTVRTALARELDRKKQAKSPSAFAEVALFDAITGGNELTTTTNWVLARLEADREVLADPAKGDDEKTAYLKTSPRFRGYYSSYAFFYEKLQRSICDWFRKHVGELGLWADTLWSHYQLIPTKVGHEEVMRGSKAGDWKSPAGKGNIADVINSLDMPTAAKSLQESCGVRPQSTTAPPSAGKRAETDAEAAILAAEAGVDRGRVMATMLGKIASILGMPTSLVASWLVEALRNAVARGDRVDSGFIKNVARTTLELLPEKLRKRFESVTWNALDYPGAKFKVTDTSQANLEKWRSKPGYVVFRINNDWYIKGTHQDDAQAMLDALALVRPHGGERRANTGGTAILTKSEFAINPAAYDQYISDQLNDVVGQGVKMNRYAAAMFAEMYEAAAKDGVKLSISNAFRGRKKAEASAKLRDNPKAVASFSSHSLGLAIDLNLWVKEMGASKGGLSTAMTNVSRMLGAPAYKWMFMRGAQFGFYQYRMEPWHWEYNPPDFSEKFWAEMPALTPKRLISKKK
ncbi:MAG: D-alanyl-D-alanine carboxypeptidase family protein [Actinomycetota bacterium]